jgi:O-antigen ligase
VITGTTSPRAPLPAWPALAAAVILGGAGLGVVVSEGTMPLIGAAAAVMLLVAVCSAIAIAPAHLRLATAEIVVLAGLLAPVAVQQDRTSTQITSSPVTPLAVAQGVIPVACIVAVLLLVRPTSLPATATEVWIAAFLIAATLSTIWSVDPKITFLKALQLVVAYALILLWVRLVPGRDVIARLSVLVHAVLLAALVGLVIAPSSAVAPIPGADPTPRLRGIFPVIAPDLLGFMAVIGLLYLAANIGPRWTLRPGVRLGLAAAYVVVLVLTRARISLVLLVLGLVVLMLQDRRRRSRLGLALTIAAAASVCVLSLYAGEITGYVARGESTQSLSTLTGRTVTWHDAESAWAKQPLTGYGFYAGHRLGVVSSIDAQNLDSMWVETLLDVGLVGTIPLAGLLIAGGVAVVRRRRTHSGHLAIAIYVTAFASSFVNPSLQEANYPMVVFATVLLARAPKKAARVTRPAL